MKAGDRPEPSAWRQVVAFAPMCALAAAHWAELLVGPPAWRIAAVVAIATGCGLVLVLSARLEPHGRLEARIVRVATVGIALLGGLVAVGIPAAVLAPPGWEQLVTGLVSGSNSLPERWPYGGDDVWVRRAVLAAIPAMAVPAAAFALWPAAAGPGGREAAATRRVGALALLLSLVAFAGSERVLADPSVRGALLLLALVLWLFLPGAHARPSAAVAATAVVVVAALISLPVVTALEATPPVVDRSPEQRRSQPAGETRAEGGERPPARERRRGRQERARTGGSPPRGTPDRRGGSSDRERDAGLPALALVLGGIAALAAGLLVVRRARRQGRRGRSAGDEADELRAALERLGWNVPPSTTLTELERRLGEGAGPAAARYARRLRESRFAAPVDRSPSGLDRRGLRRALTAGHGPLVRMRGLLALPPAALGPRR